MTTAAEKLAGLLCQPEDIDGFEVICINGKLSIDGQAHLPHEACAGTGRKYPILSRECPCLRAGDADGVNHAIDDPPWGMGTCKRPCYLFERHDAECFNCGGSNRVPNVTLATLMAAARSQGYVTVQFNDSVEGVGRVCTLSPLKDVLIGPRRWGEDDLDALANALWAAEQAQEAQDEA